MKSCTQAAYSAVKASDMKVLCFGRFYDDVPGGMQRHIEHLFGALKGSVEYVHLVPSRDRSGGRFQLHGFPVIRTPSWNVDGSLALSPGLIREAIRLHRQHRFDLIHLHFPDPMSHLASMALPASIPRVISWHADIVRQKNLLKLYRPLLQRAIDTATAIIVATPNHISSSPELAAIRNRGKLHIIPYGFDFGSLAIPSPAAVQIRNRFPGKLVFALGRHVYYKGFDVLIHAMRRTAADAHLLLGGVGPLTKSLQDLAHDLGLSNRVHFVGMIPDHELAGYYQACDVFCLPATSNAEAFGIVQIEAMAASKPVISTTLTSGVSFVNRHEETGLLVPPNDPMALAHAIDQLLADEGLRKRLGSAARDRALSEFTIQKMGEATLKVYLKSAQSLSV